MTPLVLIPGMMCDARLWRSQLLEFGRERAVHLAPISNHDNMADLASEIIDNAPSSFVLGGLSMGGIVAMEVLRQAPERIAALLLCDTNPYAEAEEMQAMRGPQIQQARKGEMMNVMREAMFPRYLHPDLPEAQKSALTKLAESMAEGLGAEVFVRQSKALRDRPDQTQTLSQCKVPALVVTGSHDQLCPMDRHETIHNAIEGSSLVVIDGAGHLPVLEQAESVNQKIARFLGELESC